MKKSLLLVIGMLLYLSASSFAQDRYGIKGGLAIAKQKWSEGGLSYTSDARTGGVFGAFFKFQVSESFAIQPELLYVMKGAKASSEVFGGEFDSDVTFKHDYLSIPIIAKVYFGGFNIQAGPSFDILVSSKIASGSMEVDVKDSFKGLDLGLALGLGYDFSNGMMIEGRYVLGLSNMADDYDFGDMKMTNNCFLFTLGFAF